MTILVKAVRLLGVTLAVHAGGSKRPMRRRRATC
jgi:hypothetical protein